MKITEASSELFWRALKVLPRNERACVLKKMITDREVMEEIVDIIVGQCSKKTSGVLDG